MNLWIIHWSEIGLKGKNRSFFENKLKENIEKQTGFKVKKIKGRFIVEGDLTEMINKIPGISYGLKIIGVFEKPEEIVKSLNFKESFTFKVITKRADKDWPETSIEISKKLMKLIVEKFPYLQVDLKNPQKKIYVEYFEKNFWVGLEKIVGIGGLPVGSSGKGLSLLSCGFDSPVASFLMLKRGMKLDFLHFYSYPQTSLLEKEAAFEIFKILSSYQPQSCLYFSNILEVQKYLFNNVPKKYLTLFYRRAMFKIAKKLKEEKKLDALITGESLGQVASQTIQNILATTKDLDVLILRPLIGFNKQEIIDISYKIGTGKISEKNFQDCCLLFNPKNPITKASFEKIKEIESSLTKLDELIQKSFEEIEVYHWPGK